MKVGEIANFSLLRNGKRNHVTKVEIMSCTTAVNRTIFTCRRVDNGIVILAFDEDLQKPKPMES